MLLDAKSVINQLWVPRRISAGLFCIVIAMLGGCGPKKLTSLAPSPMLNSFESGDYQEAYRLAEKALDKDPDDAGATYVAGLSLHRLERHQDAIPHLMSLRHHPDIRLAGPASATLGLIYNHRAQYSQALEHFRQAVTKLNGNDAAQAYYHMALAEQRLGRWAGARTHLQLAKSRAKDPVLRDVIEERMLATGFTLQLGAYSDRANAEQRARSMWSRLRQAGVERPRIVPSTTSSGMRLFLVQAGRFRSYDAARATRTQLKNDDLMIVSIR